MRTIQDPSNSNKHKIGRNDPCFCGSGKKYKKCCLLNSENFESGNESFYDEEAVFQKLGNNVKERYKDSEVTLQTAEEMGLDKMSGIIFELVGELLEQANGNREKKNIISMGVVAWNIAILSNDTNMSPLECIEDFLRTTEIEEGSEEEAVTSAVLLALVIKKQEIFPNIRRLVMDFEIKATKNDLNLTVASSELPMKKGGTRKSKKQGNKQVA